MDFSNLQIVGHARRASRFLDANPILSYQNVQSARVPLAFSAGTRILDVGCGTGDGTRALALAVGPSGHVLGIDLDPVLLAAASAKGAMPQLTWMRANGCAVPVPASSYDICWLDRVLAHCIRPIEVIAETRRLLKVGGRLFSCEIEYTAIRFATSTGTVRTLHDQYLRSIRSPEVACQLRAVLAGEFRSAFCSQRRDELMFRTRRELVRALALSLWARAQLDLGSTTPKFLQSAARDLALLESAGSLQVTVPIRWTLMWT